jgi:hypothetical protein
MQDVVGRDGTDHQSAFRSGLLLLIVLLLLSNGWFAYSRALSLANQYAHRAVVAAWSNILTALMGSSTSSTPMPSAS